MPIEAGESPIEITYMFFDHCINMVLRIAFDFKVDISSL